MGGVKMGKEAKEIALNIRKQKLIDELNQFVSDGNQLYDWRTSFRNKVWHLKYEYENLTGSEISLPTFFSDYLGFNADDIEIPEEVAQARKQEKATSPKSITKTQYSSKKARLKEEARLEKRKQKLVAELKNFVESGNDISNWRSKFKDKVGKLKGQFEKHLGEKLTMEDFFASILNFEESEEFAPNYETKLERRRQNVINVLNEYVRENGSIYGWKKIGIEGKINWLRQCYQKIEGEELSINRLFSEYFGIEYDAFYAMHLEKMQELAAFADKNNCIDSIRGKEIGTPESTLYIFLNSRAQKIGCSVFDYVLLTTDFHFSNGFVQGNYVDYVKMLAEKTTPDGSTLSPSQNKRVYKKILHLSNRSINENLSTEDVIKNVLGLEPGEFASQCSGPRVGAIDEEKLVTELRALADETGDVAGLTAKNPQLYGQLKNITRGETPQMFLERHGLTNSNSTYRPRFSFIETDYEQRKAELFPIRDQIIAEGEYDFDNMTQLQKYYARLEIAQKTIKAYLKLGLQRYSDEFFPIHSEDDTELSIQEFDVSDDNLQNQEADLLEPTTEDEPLQTTEQNSAQEYLQRKLSEESPSTPPELEDSDGKID